MDEVHHSERRGGWWWIAPAAVLGLGVLYPLSVGPAIRWHDATSNDSVRHGIEMFYMPLEWLHEHTPLREPLDRYVELWQ